MIHAGLPEGHGALGVSALAGSATSAARETPFDGLLGGLSRIIRDPIALGFLLFTVSAVVSTIASISPITSVFGAHESFTGLLTVVAYTILFFATRALCRTLGDGRRLVIAAVIGAGV